MQSKAAVQSVSNDSAAVLAAVRAQMVAENPSFETRLPEITKGNLRDFGAAVVNYQPTANAFIDTLVNLIGKIWITHRLFTNPLKVLKKGILEYGDTVEMLYTQVAQAHQFDPAVAEKQWMKREIPNVATAFAKLNYQVFYKQTISDDQLRNAFMSWQGVSDFISSVFEGMYNGAELDEYLTMKQQLAAYGTAGKFGVEVMGAVTNEATAKQALAKLKAVSNKMTFMRNDYNSIGVTTNTPKSKQVLVIDADTDAQLNVLGYGTLFNLEPAAAQYRVIVLDEIPLSGCHAILMDEDFYAVWDCLNKFTRDMNPEGLYWQYYAHYWRVFAICPWANAIAFVETEPTITAVTVTPATVSVAKGANTTLTATVTGTGVFPKSVEWSVTGASSSSTTISPYGTLYVGADETAATLTVKATSTYDTTQAGSSTVTVTTS